MQLVVPILLGISASVSTGLNATVLYVFAKLGARKITFKDVLMLSMTVGDLIQSLLGYSLEIYSMGERNGGARKSEIGINFCKAAGFIVTFLALSSTAHLTALAYDRYLTICKPFKADRIHRSSLFCISFVSVCWLYALVWSALPFLGWSGYSLEDDQLRCSIDWASRDLKDQLYIVFLFIFCFVFPVSVMIYSFVLVKKELREMLIRASNLLGRESKASQENVRAERRHTKLAIVMCVVFISTWLPYSLLSFWASFFTHIAKTPVALGSICAIIAKSSTIFNPIIYTVMHKRFRQSLMNTWFRRFICMPFRIHPEETSNKDFNQHTTVPSTINQN